MTNADTLQTISASSVPDTHLHTWQTMPPLEHDADAPHIPPLPHSPLAKTADSIHKHFTASIPTLRNSINTTATPINKELQQYIEHIDYTPQGIIGDPLPYRFKYDSSVNLLILLNLFLIIWVLSRSSRYLHHNFKHLFSAPETRRSYTTKTENELSGQLFLVIQTCFTLGILSTYYVQICIPDLFTSISPYEILFTSSALYALYYLIKVGLYRLINQTFFNTYEARAWNEAYMLSVLILGITLFPIALLVVYFELNFSTLIHLFLILLILSKFILLSKGTDIFSSTRLRYLHIFLYLCTLEILPLLVLWRTLNYTLRALIAIY